MNSMLRTMVLLAALTTVFGVVGLLMGGGKGMIFALMMAAGMNIFSYWNADKIVLRRYNALEVTSAHPDHHIARYAALTAGLAARAQMPQPKIYIVENDQPNAFATGRNPENAAVAATTGLLRLLTEEELAGVMAHELAHVKNRDTLTMTLTATIAGAITALAHFALFFRGGDTRHGGILPALLISFLAPMAAAIVQMAISRTREYQADRIGAEICGQPLWLAAALAKISNGAAHIPNPTAEAHPETGHLMIINPLSGRGADSLFSTHPATQNRIEALTTLAQEMGRGQAAADQPRSGNHPDRASGHPPKGPWG